MQAKFARPKSVETERELNDMTSIRRAMTVEWIEENGAKLVA
jgi:hypothetical protein